MDLKRLESTSFFLILVLLIRKSILLLQSFILYLKLGKRYLQSQVFCQNNAFLMRNIRHHALVVTCNDKKLIESIRSKALELYKLHMEASNGSLLVSEIKNSIVNQYASFFIIPDGSKEGYDASDDGDVIREKLIDFIKPFTGSEEYHLSYGEISYGADDGKTTFRHN